MPWKLAIVQAFVNTRDMEGRRDVLDAPSALVKWIARHDLAPPALIDETGWRKALAVREGLRAEAQTSGLSLVGPGL